VASDEITAPASGAADTAGGARRRPWRTIGLVVAAVVLFDILALVAVPPFPKGGTAGDPCAFPVCFIEGTLEFPPPHVVWDLDPANPLPSVSRETPLVIGFHPSITNSLLTMWIVMAVVLLVAFVAARRLRAVPGGLQNLVEWGYEGLQNWALSNGGRAAVSHIPIFAAFFLLILFGNWSGLVPPIGRTELLRAPTSDLNVTIGLALVAFTYFEYQGFRANGLGGYLGKFFPLGEFRKGVGAGAVALFVGLIELMLEFVKPVTLSLRLFGNIYGGEVALGVITALTLAILPIAVIGLEVLLNFVQALIFSTLTLMFTLVAVQSHHEEDHPRPATAPGPAQAAATAH